MALVFGGATPLALAVGAVLSVISGTASVGSIRAARTSVRLRTEVVIEPRALTLAFRAKRKLR